MGAAFIGAFYAAGKNAWESAEDVWEGIFCILASIIITVCPYRPSPEDRLTRWENR
jgi:high-affinity Fe2+/Pb2+ permease